ncbi:hypothetical protein Lal_00009262 [Lupinus albus]|nr:hypothetical protein Lal_00009262 [Lupinus albus]
MSNPNEQKKNGGGTTTHSLLNQRQRLRLLCAILHEEDHSALASCNPCRIRNYDIQQCSVK